MHLFLIALSLMLPLVGVYFYGLAEATTTEEDFFIWFYIFIAQFILTYFVVEKTMYEKNVQDCSGRVHELDDWLDRAVEELDVYDLKIDKEKELHKTDIEELKDKLKQKEEESEKERVKVNEMKEDLVIETALLKDDLQSAKDRAEEAENRLEELKEELETSNKEIETSKENLEKEREEVTEMKEDLVIETALLKDDLQSAKDEIERLKSGGSGAAFNNEEIQSMQELVGKNIETNGVDGETNYVNVSLVAALHLQKQLEKYKTSAKLDSDEKTKLLLLDLEKANNTIVKSLEVIYRYENNGDELNL